MVQELAVAGIRISAIHRYSEIGQGNRVVRVLTSILLFAPAPIPSPSAEPLPCPVLSCPVMPCPALPYPLLAVQPPAFCSLLSFSSCPLQCSIFFSDLHVDSTAAALVHDFIAGGDAVKRRHAQDLLDQHHGHCRLLVVEVGQGERSHATPTARTRKRSVEQRIKQRIEQRRIEYRRIDLSCATRAFSTFTSIIYSYSYSCSCRFHVLLCSAIAGHTFQPYF